MANEQTIWTYLKKAGFSDAGAAGIMGNLFAESALNPKNLQNSYETKLGYTDDTYTAAVDSGKYKNFVNDNAGYGLCQWTYWSRKQNLLDYAKSKKVSIGDLTMQLEFLMTELSSYGLVNALKTSTSVKEASNIMLLQFERPADQSVSAQTKRANYSQGYYDQFALSNKGDATSMKYSSSNPPLQCFMRQSTWYKGAGTTTIRGVLWHSTGANNPTLKRYVQPDDNAADRAQMLALLGTNTGRNDWNHITYQAGVHAWIGKLANGEVTTVQVGPWNKQAWGCGSGRNGSCNNGWIQFEICEDALNDANYFNQIYKEACELTAYLCKLYGLDPKGTVTYNGVKVPVILCHQDSYQLGLGSNHGDVLHWFPKFGKSMNDVRNDVAALMGGNVPSAPATPSAPTDTPVNYQVKVTASGLNCRNEPDGNQILTSYPNGTILTITKESNGWGFTGVGWVSLNFTQKISVDTTVNGDDNMNLDLATFKKLYNEMRKELQDNDSSEWSESARNWAIQTGLVAGSGKLPNGQPNCMWEDVITREQMVTILYRFAQMIGKV